MCGPKPVITNMTAVRKFEVISDALTYGESVL